MSAEAEPRALIVEMSRHFYSLGWVSGTGGGMSVRKDGRIYVAPSGVEKERLKADDLYVLDDAGNVVDAPVGADTKPSACTPLFMNAYRLRGAGAVIHSHAMVALLATLRTGEAFECTELEMIKGISGHGYHDRLSVPIIENTAHECDLADSMAAAMDRYPRTHAVLVRRHGVYVWGKDATEAKTHAECYHYLFEAVVRMEALGLDAAWPAPPVLGMLEGGKR